MKVTGLGMKLPLDSFCIDISDLGVSIEQHVNEQKSYFLKEFDLKDGYQYACCGESDDFEDKMKIIDLSEVR